MNRLSQEDIADIARIEYSEYKNDKIFSQFKIVESVKSFRDAIDEFKISIMDKAKTQLTLLINLGDKHWVVFVIFYKNNIYIGYYMDSKPGMNSKSHVISMSELESSYKDILKNKPGVEWIDLSVHVAQQLDSHNYGLWALENAADINRILGKNKPLYQFIIELKERPRRDESYFQEKRRYFSNKLLADLIRQNRLLQTSPSKHSELKKNELENRYQKQSIEINPQVFQEKNVLKRPAETDNNGSSASAKKLKSDTSNIHIRDKFFISIYMERLDNIITNLSENNKKLTILDLYNYLIIYTGQLTEEKLDEIIVSKKIQLESELRQLDKKDLINQLKNISKIDKYLAVILYKVDFVLSLISLVNTSSIYLSNEDNTSYINEKSSYILKFLHENQKINIDLRIFLADEFVRFDKYFVMLLKVKFNALKESLEDLNKIKEKLLSEEKVQGIEEIDTLKRGIRFLIENPDLRNLAQYLVRACLKNDKNGINNQIDLLRSFITENSMLKDAILLIFHASFKALILSNRKIDLINFFSEFTEKFKDIIIIKPSQLTILSNKLYEIDEVLYPDYYETEIFSLANNLSLSNLLWLSGLSKNLDKEKLDFIWNTYSGNLSNTNLLDLLSVAFIRNNVEILEWCQGKLNDNNKFIKKMHSSWMHRRDWGKGPYIEMLKQEKIKVAFELSQENKHTIILAWVKRNTKESESGEVEFKRRELIFDLAVRTRKKKYWEEPLLNLLSCNEKEKVKESYAYSRFAAEAVMKKDTRSLNEFWEEINKIEDNELKISVKKKLLVDSTWAFHGAVRSGKKELIDFFLSKLENLPLEGVRGHPYYKYNLLRGFDLVQPKVKNLVTNAVISKKIEVLEMLFDNIKKLIQELEDIIKSDVAMSEDIQEAKDKIIDLKQNYYLENSFNDTIQIDQLNRPVPDLVIALHLAAKVGNERMVKSLLETVKAKFGEPTLKSLLLAVDKNRRTVMHWVASVGDIKVLKILLEAAGNFGQQTLINLLLAEDENGETALHLAVFFGHSKASESLLKAAKQANILKYVLLNYDDNGADPLRLAIMSSDVKVMENLLQAVKDNLDNDADIKEILFLGARSTYEVGKITQETILDLAVRIGNKEIVKKLLEALENNFGLEIRNTYALKAVQLLSDLKPSNENYGASVEDYRAIKSILSEECYLESSSDLSGSSRQRRKRNTAGENCEFSWEDVDKFNEEKEKIRDFNAVKINSDQFLDYIASQSMSDIKLAQLIQLADADTVQVTGTSQDRISWLVKRQKVLTHLSKVGRVSGMVMQGMMTKNLLGDFIKGDYKGVAVNLGVIAGGQGFAKVAEIAVTKELKYISNNRRILNQSLRFSSPFLARVTSAFVGYDLVNQIKEYKKYNSDALVGIVGDGIFLGVDAVEIGIETAEIVGLLEGVSSVTGAIGATIGAIVFVGTDIYSAVKYVHEVDKLIHLTSKEKFIEGLLAFLNISPPEYIQRLIGEKEANNELVKQAMKIFEQNKEIKKYIFSSAVVVKFCSTQKNFCRIKRILMTVKRCRKEEEVCSVKNAMHENNTVLFDRKRTNIRLSRAKPDSLNKGSFFCLPVDNNEPIFQNSTYFCENAIGIEYPYNRTSNDVLIFLGNGNDVVIGFPNENHHVFLGNGHKNVTLGDGNDIFILQDNPTGRLEGGGGNNTLDLSSYAQKSEVICVDSSKVYNCFPNKKDDLNPLYFFGISTILLRKSKQDWIYTDCNMHYIDTRGGKKESETDFVFIDTPNDFNCLYDIKFIVRSYTFIKYYGSEGNFNYIIPAENKGSSTILLSATNNTGLHNFSFAYTLYDIDTLNKTGDTVVNFVFVKANNLLDITGDKFVLSIDKAQSSNIFYKLSDHTEIKVGNDSFYAFQSTYKPIETIIKDYPKIANKLRMYIFVILPLTNEMIAIGHGNHDVLYNNPYYKSHLIGNGGEDIFLVTSGYEILDEDKLPIPEVVLYDVNDENLIDTLDLREIRKQLKKDLGLEIKARTNLADNDILIHLFSIDETERVVVTIRLKDALFTNWYKRLHIILNHVPMELKELNLKALPLEFGEDKDIIVIFPEDIEEETKLIIAKKSENYCFFRSGNNLIITNAFDNNVTTNEQRFMLLLNQFYQIPKMEALSIRFVDKEVFIKNEMQRITNAITLEAQVAQYKQATYGMFFNRTIEFQRNRRSIPREKENVANSATSMSDPISNTVSWLKEKGSVLISIISTVIPGLYQNLVGKAASIYEQQTLEHLENSNSCSEKNNRSFTTDSDYSYNLTDNVYLLKYVLYYLGWVSLVNRMNQAECILAYPNESINVLDLAERYVKIAVAIYEIIYDHDSSGKAVLYRNKSSSTAQSDGVFITKPTGKRNAATFFQLASVQSSTSNDSRINASQIYPLLITGKK